MFSKQCSLNFLQASLVLSSDFVGKCTKIQIRIRFSGKLLYSVLVVYTEYSLPSSGCFFFFAQAYFYHAIGKSSTVSFCIVVLKPIIWSNMTTRLVIIAFCFFFNKNLKSLTTSHSYCQQ